MDADARGRVERDAPGERTDVDGEAILFDMDGVPVHSEPIHFATTNAVLARRGASIDRAHVDRPIGMDEGSVFAALVAEFGLDESAEVLAGERVAASLRALAWNPLSPCQGALECQLTRRADGRRLGLAASGTREQVSLVVDRLVIRQVLGAIVSADDVERAQAAPDRFLEAAARLDAEPAA